MGLSPNSPMFSGGLNEMVLLLKNLKKILKKNLKRIYFNVKKGQNLTKH